MTRNGNAFGCSMGLHLAGISTAFRRPRNWRLSTSWVSIKGALLQAPLQYVTEGFKGSPQIGDYHAESCEPLGQQTYIFPVLGVGVLNAIRWGKICDTFHPAIAIAVNWHISTRISWQGWCKLFALKYQLKCIALK